jgi:hypothetical protein
MPLPGLVSQVYGSAPDFVGSMATVIDGAGKSWVVSLGVNTATWVSNGSPAIQAHWSFVDLTA